MDFSLLLISKVVSQLLLPPGGLILLAVLGVVFWKRVWARGLVALVLCAFWLLSTEPVRDMLMHPLESEYAVFHAENADIKDAVIVLLGAGVYEHAPEYNGKDMLTSDAMMRTLYAADIAKKTGLAVYATGGKALSHADEAEGDVMRRWLMRLGMPASQVYAENLASNTWENAVYMRHILQKKGIDKIILVSTAWHLPRAVWCFQSQGFTVIPAGTDYLAAQPSYDVRSFMPHWAVFADSAEALHEYLGIVWYHLRYHS